MHPSSQLAAAGGSHASSSASIPRAFSRVRLAAERWENAIARFQPSETALR